MRDEEIRRDEVTNINMTRRRDEKEIAALGGRRNRRGGARGCQVRTCLTTISSVCVSRRKLIFEL